MTQTEKNQPSAIKKQPVNQTMNEKFQFPESPQSAPNEDISGKGARIYGNLEDSYDRLKNTNIKISSRLKVSSVSDHLELAGSRNLLSDSD